MKHSSKQWLHKLHRSDPNSAAASSVSIQGLLKYDFILNAMTDGVMIINPAQVIVSFNNEAATITGWPKNEALTLNYHSVLQLVNDKHETTSLVEDIIARTFKEGKPLRNNESSLVSRSKKKVAVNLSVSPLFDTTNRQVIAVVVVFQDVTQERLIQQQRAEFISTASHEMRTPVAAIEGYVSLALNDNIAHVDVKAHEYLEKALASTQSLGRLFQGLLTSSQADDDRLPSHSVIIEMGDYLSKLMEEFRAAVAKKGLQFELVVGAEKITNSGATAVETSTARKIVRPLYYVEADPDRLHEVVANLFDNAIKYTNQGSISIGLTGDNSVVQLSVRDTGIGIPADDVLHLFQKFYRVDNSMTQVVNGTGLGLYISRKIVELYNGRIWVESQLGQGSSFYVNLARVSSEKAATKQRLTPPTPATQAATAALATS